MEFFAVHLKLRPQSHANFHYDLETAPDTLENPNFPGYKIKPTILLISLMPGQDGRWVPSMIVVSGPRYLKTDSGERLSKRTERIPFLIADEGIHPDDGLPEWVTEIAEHHALLMNDGSQELEKRQQDAARAAAREMFENTRTDMADGVADKILAAIRRVG